MSDCIADGVTVTVEKDLITRSFQTLKGGLAKPQMNVSHARVIGCKNYGYNW